MADWGVEAALTLPSVYTGQEERSFSIENTHRFRPTSVPGIGTKEKTEYAVGEEREKTAGPKTVSFPTLLFLYKNITSVGLMLMLIGFEGKSSILSESNTQ